MSGMELTPEAVDLAAVLTDTRVLNGPARTSGSLTESAALMLKRRLRWEHLPHRTKIPFYATIDTDKCPHQAVGEVSEAEEWERQEALVEAGLHAPSEDDELLCLSAIIGQACEECGTLVCRRVELAKAHQLKFWAQVSTAALFQRPKGGHHGNRD